MKRLFLIGGVITLLLIAAVAYVLRPTAEAGAPIEAVPLVIDAEATATDAGGLQTTLPSGTVVATATDAGSLQNTLPSGTIVYVISQDDSEVRFSIDEILRSVPTTAIGITNQVAGEIAINFDEPSNSQVGEIQVNARTLTTDSNNRNKIIQNEILDTAAFEFIHFNPTAITGLPAEIEIGQTVAFQVIGELTIRSISFPATFEVTAVVGTDGQLTGSGSTVVLRSDYDLVIPSVPSVADVSDEVILEIDFVADPK